MSALAAILELTEQVQSAIDGGDWPRARELEAERRAALERLASERSTGAELPSALAALYARNQRMIGEVEHHRRRVLREASTIETGQAAASAYRAALDSGAEPR